MKALKEGGAPGTGIPLKSLYQVRDDVFSLMGDVVGAYSTNVARGEVGAGGKSRSGSSKPKCPTGLLYGRIQSGKTNAMILTTAVALDNGFRVIVVLTTNFTKLVAQTHKDFRILTGPLIHSSNEIKEWSTDIRNIRSHISSHGLVVICGKDSRHLSSLQEVLKKVGAQDYPALIFDDEADQATPDTNKSRRSKGGPNAPKMASKIHRLAVNNDADDEFKKSVREILRHNVFVQVTATPAALLLQRIEHILRPKFTRLLRPGEGYVGGDYFFSKVSRTANDEYLVLDEPPLDIIDDDEGERLRRQRSAPNGLKDAIIFFLLSASAHSIRTGQVLEEGYKFLAHSSPKTTEHEHLNLMIKNFTDDLTDDFKAKKFSAETQARMKRQYKQLKLTLKRDTPSFASIVSEIAKRLPRRKVIPINSRTDKIEFGSDFNFMVGGNILGRGLAIKKLFVTYYVREPQKTQMDTMHQHARMYGYRASDLPYVRVFLPRGLAIRFFEIQKSEDHLRKLLEQPKQKSKVPVARASGLRITRSAILDLSTISTYEPGEGVYPITPAYRSADLGRSVVRIDACLSSLLGEQYEKRKFHKVTIDDLVEIISMIRVLKGGGGKWDPTAIEGILKSVRSEFKNGALIYVNDMLTRRGPELETGVLPGPLRTEAARKRMPVLFLTHSEGKKQFHWAGVRFWYPTLVFPNNMDWFVFNVTA